MPLDSMISSAESAAALSASMGEHPVRQKQDLLAQELLAWFKQDFFTWVSAYNSLCLFLSPNDCLLWSEFELNVQVRFIYQFSLSSIGAVILCVPKIHVC